MSTLMDSRNRYHAAFSSNHFDAKPDAGYDEIFRFARFPHSLSDRNNEGRTHPAGKRPDQTTEDMFGAVHEKDLQAMPKTFDPKYENLTAHERKQHFLSSPSQDVLPHNIYHHSQAPLATTTTPRVLTTTRRTPDRRGATMLPKSAGCSAPTGDLWTVDSHEDITAKMRRQIEHSTDLTGWSETPAANYEDVHNIHRRLTPNNYQWFSIPEKLNAPNSAYATMKDKDRYFKEKNSHLMREVLEGTATLDSHRTPHHVQNVHATESQVKHVEAVEDVKHRSDIAYYSDIFWKDADMQTMPSRGDYYPKKTGSPEDRIIRHSEWSDSHTEIIVGSRNTGGCNRESLVQTPRGRKNMELHRSRIWNEKNLGPANENLGPQKGMAFMTDNSDKVRRKSLDQTHSRNATQGIHQMNLQSSVTAPEFYEESHGTRDWEVVEMRVLGLDSNVTRRDVKNLCDGFNLQIVKVSIDWNPVVNVSKGRATVQIRYNPLRESGSLDALVHKLRERHLQVQI